MSTRLNEIIYCIDFCIEMKFLLLSVGRSQFPPSLEIVTKVRAKQFSMWNVDDEVAAETTTMKIHHFIALLMLLFPLWKPSRAEKYHIVHMARLHLRRSRASFFLCLIANLHNLTLHIVEQRHCEAFYVISSFVTRYQSDNFNVLTRSFPRMQSDSRPSSKRRR